MEWTGPEGTGEGGLIVHCDVGGRGTLNGSRRAKGRDGRPVRKEGRG